MKICRWCKLSKPFTDFHREPRVKDGHAATCKQCEKEKTAARKAKNPKTWMAARRQEQTKWRTSHPEAALEKGRTWRAAHSQRSLNFSKRWAAANPDKTKAKFHRYRARKARANGSATAEQIAARAAFFGNRCWICQGPAEETDHVIPLSKGGTGWPANLRPICRVHNGAKGGRYPFFAQLVL